MKIEFTEVYGFKNIESIIYSLGKEYILKGIRFRKNSWEVAVSRQCKNIYIGSYKTKEDAINAKMKFLYNEFAENIAKINCNISNIYKTEYYGFFVTTKGNVINKYGNEIKGHVGKCGYKEVVLSINNKPKNVLAHRLILKSICPIDNDENFDVNHKDGNKLNNQIENLEWCTRYENVIHSFRNGLQKTIGNQYGKFKVLSEDEINIIAQHLHHKSYKEIAKIIGCNPKTVSKYAKKIMEGYYET